MSGAWTPPAPGREVRSYWIFSGARAVMGIEGRPGQLISVAPPGPGGFVNHPWLHGVSRGYEHEHALRQILLASAGFDDFLARLVAADYDLASQDAEIYDLEGAARRVLVDGRPVAVFWAGPGPLSALWWQPEDTTPAHTLVTLYEPGEAARIAAALAATDSVEAFAAAVGS